MIECAEARPLGRVGNLELDAIKFDSYRTSSALIHGGVEGCSRTLLVETGYSCVTMFIPAPSTSSAVAIVFPGETSPSLLEMACKVACVVVSELAGDGVEGVNVGALWTQRPISACIESAVWEAGRFRHDQGQLSPSEEHEVKQHDGNN
jgi:hypothetical protein